MAKVKFSALVSDMRNKLNGSVFSKNRAGNYLRNKTTPVNPRTSFQQAIRQQLGSLSSKWNALTESQRATWRGAVTNFPYTDIFGDRKELDGKSLMIKLNMNLLNVGKPEIDVAPKVVAIPELTLVSGDASVGSGIALGISPGTVPTGYSLLVYATPPQNAGVYFMKNRFRSLGAFEATAGVIDITSVYSDRFGAITASDVGKAVSFKCAFVSDSSGQLGVPVDVRSVIEA